MSTASPSVAEWVVEVYEPAVGVLRRFFEELGFDVLGLDGPDRMARACLARLADHEPPIGVELLDVGSRYKREQT